jgi:choline dehydrogenase
MKAREFDYIIVGAGSAGCAIANRLSEDAGQQVLIVEAGNWAKTWMRRMPAAVKQLMLDPSIAWGFRTAAEPGLNGREIDIRRGKVVGGCSQINGMIYSRGHPRDYDDWSAMGCRGWSYQEVLPYFKRSESSWAGETAEHGASGPLLVTRPNVASLMIDRFSEATRSAGYRGSHDYHADYVEGFSRVELTVGRGLRSSTGATYLRPALTRPNLTLLTDMHVKRVVIEKGRAVGIETVVAGGSVERITARQEIILSAGAYGSPQLLMLSGIGHPDELRSVGIKVMHPAAYVGRNLVEHPMMKLQFSALPKTFLNELRIDRAVGSIVRWALLRNGPFTTNACAGNAYIKSTSGLDRPDIQINMAALHLGAWLWGPGFGKAPEHSLTVNVIGLAQDSRGTVTLASSDPFAHPRIQTNLLTAESDIQRMIRGIRIAREIYAQPALSDLVTGEMIPGPTVQTDAQLEAAMRQTAQPTEHPVGTCRMGTDADAVVDPELRVVGVDGLRVADASIMPRIPSGNTNVPTIMIGEKAADLIKNGPAPSERPVRRLAAVV